MNEHLVKSADPLSPGQVAKILDVSNNTIIRLVDNPNYKELNRADPLSNFREVPFSEVLHYVGSRPILNKNLLHFFEETGYLENNAMSIEDCGLDALVGDRIFRFHTEPLFLTTQEAADILKCSQQTVIRVYDSGSLHGFKIPPNNKFRRIEATSLAILAGENGLYVENDLSKHIPYYFNFPGFWERDDLACEFSEESDIYYRETEEGREASVRFKRQGLYVKAAEKRISLFATGPEINTGFSVSSQLHLHAISARLSYGRELLEDSETLQRNHKSIRAHDLIIGVHKRFLERYGQKL